MDLHDAIEQSAKAYFRGTEFANLNKTLDKRAKFTKRYFDRLEEEQFGNSTTWESLKKQFQDT